MHLAYVWEMWLRCLQTHQRGRLDMNEPTPSRRPEASRITGASALLEGADPTVLVIAGSAVLLAALAVVCYTGGSLTVMYNDVSMSLSAFH